MKELKLDVVSLFVGAALSGVGIFFLLVAMFASVPY